MSNGTTDSNNQNCHEKNQQGHHFDQDVIANVSKEFWEKEKNHYVKATFSVPALATIPLFISCVYELLAKMRNSDSAENIAIIAEIINAIAALTRQTMDGMREVVDALEKTGFYDNLPNKMRSVYELPKDILYEYQCAVGIVVAKEISKNIAEELGDENGKDDGENQNSIG